MRFPGSFVASHFVYAVSVVAVDVEGGGNSRGAVLSICRFLVSRRPRCRCLNPPTQPSECVPLSQTPNSNRKISSRLNDLEFVCCCCSAVIQSLEIASNLEPLLLSLVVPRLKIKEGAYDVMLPSNPDTQLSLSPSLNE